MHQFVFQQGLSGELQLFPQIIELGAKKNQAIHLHSFPQSVSEGIRIYYINEGKFEWRKPGGNHQKKLMELAIDSISSFAPPKE